MRFLRLLAFCLVLLGQALPGVAAGLQTGAVAPAEPDAALAQALLGLARPPELTRREDGVPGWDATVEGEIVGYIASTWEVAGSVGYSGRPLDVLVAVDPGARIAGARLMRHDEPVLTLGISDADIARYVSGFAGYDLNAPRAALLQHSEALPDVISRATVSTGVIRDGILRTARTLAIGRGVLAGAGGIDRVGYRAMDWPTLLETGALSHLNVTMTEAAEALAGAKVPINPGDNAFIEIYAGLADPPSVGRNLLGQQAFTEATGALGPGDTALVILSRGLYSHRGTEWRKTGRFERLTLAQGDTRIVPEGGDFLFVRRLRIDGAPEFKEISIFRLRGGAIDPTQPFRIELAARRPAASGGDVAAAFAMTYELPAAFRVAAAPEPAPLWQEIWQAKRPAAGAVVALVSVLTLLLFLQESVVRRPKLWRGLRLGFLAVTLVGLGWGLNGQLSVVQVVAFVHSLLSGFRWETFLIEPVIFILWSFVALGLLFWGRGVYCGWLCPFGALQELVNAAAQWLGVKQIAVPQALHERLWVIKYTLFVAILALSFYSMRDALILAEAEPFKTAISLRMVRAWPFVLFVLLLLVAGLFIERFYCRYLCPLGAGLAIPAKLKVFDWLKRRPQCGRECRLCETKCTVGAIDPLGRINPNECVLCLRCQVIYHDAATCTVLKRRARPTTEAT